MRPCRRLLDGSPRWGNSGAKKPLPRVDRPWKQREKPGGKLEGAERQEGHYIQDHADRQYIAGSSGEAFMKDRKKHKHLASSCQPAPRLCLANADRTIALNA